MNKKWELTIDLMQFVFWPVIIFLAIDGLVNWWIVFLFALHGTKINVSFDVG